MDPVSDQAIELNLERLQEVHTSKVETYQKWVQSHCRSRQYTFQIRKCKDENCCLPPRLTEEQMQWLPDPVLYNTKNITSLSLKSKEQRPLSLTGQR